MNECKLQQESSTLFSLILILTVIEIVTSILLTVLIVQYREKDLINQMIVLGSDYRKADIGRGEGTFRNDEEGFLTTQNLGRNMPYVLEELCA